MNSLPSAPVFAPVAPLREVGAAQPDNDERTAARWFVEDVQPHEPALRAYLRNRFPTFTDVDDLVQEAYSRVLRSRNRGLVRSPKSLLFATARNAALDFFRHKQVISIENLANIDELAVLESGPSTAETLNHEHELELLSEAIDTLPERCREILMLKKIDGLSYEEIAHKLGISKNTISAQITIGMMRCRDYLRSRGMNKI